MIIANSLEENYEELENYFSNTIIPQLFVDAQFILRKFTPPAMKQFNLAPSDIGKNILDIQDNFRIPTIEENIREVIESNQILEKEIQTTDMSWYQMNILPYVRRSDKKTNGVIITFVDITNRIRDLNDLENVIADYEILLDELSHDIRNPLANMRLVVDHLKEIDPNNQTDFENMVRIVDESVYRMTDMIEELTATRKEKHKYKGPVEILNIENIIEDVRLALSDNIQSSGAKIHSDLQAKEIKFVRRNLRSVLYNLVGNSIKYKANDRKPEITIRSEQENGHTIISVKDNGMGIDKSHQDKIFRKYHRVNRTGDGSGIGLYLVNEIVQSAGGMIEVSSEPDKGTEMRVFILTL